MKHRLRTRVFLEALEDRWCPSVNFSSNNGTLLITGSSSNPGGSIAITETAANTIAVTDGGNPVTTQTGIKNVTVKLTSADDNVAVNLGGFTLQGNLNINLGSGTNVLSLGNGTIGGELKVAAGSGTDHVTLGDGSTSLTVSKNTSIDTDGGANDALMMQGGVDLKGSLLTDSISSITLANQSTVEKNATFLGSKNGSTIELDGSIQGRSVFLAPFISSSTSSKLTLGSNGSIGSDLVFTSSLFSKASNTLDVEGKVGGDVFFFGTGQGDTLTEGASGSIGHNLIATFGEGSNQVDIAGSIGNNVFLTVGGGTVTVEPTAIIANRADILLIGKNATVDFNGTVGPSGGTSLALNVESLTGPNTVILDAKAVINGNAKVKLLGSGNTVTNNGAKITGTLQHTP